MVLMLFGAMPRSTRMSRQTWRAGRGRRGHGRPERDFPLFLSWYKQGKLPLDKLVTRRYWLDQINEACADPLSGRILGRAVVEF
jgi:Zn-dependent alcohol dehydrogenase